MTALLQECPLNNSLRPRCIASTAAERERPATSSASEDPLCRSQQTEPEAYRFIWHSSFDGNALIHVTRRGDAIALRWKRMFSGLASVALSLNDWEKLQPALMISNFWSLDTADERVGLDGAQWLIEGRRGDIYRSVERWSPQGEVHNLGRLFFALAGPPLASVELY
jgi:hypothetical protein